MAKSLKFVPHLVKMILSGEETCTWRFFDDKDLKTGDILDFVEKENGNIFAMAEITSVKEKKFGDVESSDLEGHEKFESKEKMYGAYRSYYGNKIAPDTLVKIVRFKRI